MNKKTLKNPCFKVDEDEAYCPGVYKIENRDFIYIGSTRISLAHRFLQHYHNENGYHFKTYNVLHNGGDFVCLESFGYCDIEDLDEQDLRDSEAKYIRIFKNNTDKNFLNETLPENMSKKKDQKYHNLKIPDNLYDDIIENLHSIGYLVMRDKVYHKKFDPLDDFDDMAHAYGQMGLFDYMEFMDVLGCTETNEKLDCKTLSVDVDKTYGHVWLSVQIDDKEERIDILENILSFQ